MAFLLRLALQEKKVMTALKSRASLTCFRVCFLPGWAKDLSAHRYRYSTCGSVKTCLQVFGWMSWRCETLNRVQRRQWTFEFRNRLMIDFLAERFLASKERHSAVRFWSQWSGISDVSWRITHWYIYIYIYIYIQVILWGRWSKDLEIQIYKTEQVQSFRKSQGSSVYSRRWWEFISLPLYVVAGC